MWIYFNEEGTLTTCIQHGQVIRQGNAFDLYICFPNKESSLNLSPSVSFDATDSGSFETAGRIDTYLWGVPVKFEKENDGEIVNDFVDGKRYICYHIIVDSAYNVTRNYGKVPMLVTISTASGTSYEALATLQVARTIGSNKPTTISVSEYESLLSNIREYTTMYTFPFDLCNGISYPDYGNEAHLYSWKGMGFIKGTVAVSTAFVSEEKGKFKDILVLDTSIRLKAGCNFLGTDSEGNDVQLRADNVNGKIIVSVYNNFDKACTVSFTGVCFVDASSIMWSGGTQPTATNYTVIGVGSTTIDVVNTLTEPDVEVSLVPVANTDTAHIAFKFRLPKGETGPRGPRSFYFSGATPSGEPGSSSLESKDYFFIQKIGTEDGLMNSFVHETDEWIALFRDFVNELNFRRYELIEGQSIPVTIEERSEITGTRNSDYVLAFNMNNETLQYILKKKNASTGAYEAVATYVAPAIVSQVSTKSMQAGDLIFVGVGTLEQKTLKFRHPDDCHFDYKTGKFYVYDKEDKEWKLTNKYNTISDVGDVAEVYMTNWED